VPRVARLRIGVQLSQQDTTIDELRAAWRAADDLGVDTIWVWDHFFPLYGDPNANHFEAYSLLGAMAVDTSRAQFGALVTCYPYRNPNLLADMARTIHLVSGRRFILGLGAGWFERDFREYGYEFHTAPQRLRALGHGLPVIKARLAELRPPAENMPILIGGGGERVTLRLVAEHADAWNSFGTTEQIRSRGAILDEACAEIGRDPREVLRSLEQALPRDAMVSTDIGNICSVANSYLRFERPRSMFAAMSFGNCGYAFPVICGAKVASPERPAFAYVGDGAWGISFNELLTCVRERIGVTVIVFNNEQWGAEKKNHVDFYSRRYQGVNLQNPSWAAVARAFGCEGVCVERLTDVAPALRAAAAAQSEGKTTVVEVMVTQELGDPFRRDALSKPVRHLAKYQKFM